MNRVGWWYEVRLCSGWGIGLGCEQGGVVVGGQAVLRAGVGV